jgi:hypothetical protein
MSTGLKWRVKMVPMPLHIALLLSTLPTAHWCRWCPWHEPLLAANSQSTASSDAQRVAWNNTGDDDLDSKGGSMVWGLFLALPGENCGAMATPSVLEECSQMTMSSPKFVRFSFLEYVCWPSSGLTQLLWWGNCCLPQLPKAQEVHSWRAQ